MPEVMYFLDDPHSSHYLQVLSYYFMTLLMYYMLDFYLQDPKESVPYFFTPMIIQLEKDFPHKIHGDLISSIGIKKLKEGIDDD